MLVKVENHTKFHVNYCGRHVCCWDEMGIVSHMLNLLQPFSGFRWAQDTCGSCHAYTYPIRSSIVCNCFCVESWFHQCKWKSEKWSLMLFIVLATVRSWRAAWTGWLCWSGRPRPWAGSRARPPSCDPRTTGQPAGRVHVQDQRTLGCWTGCLHGPGRPRQHGVTQTLMDSHLRPDWFSLDNNTRASNSETAGYPFFLFWNNWVIELFKILKPSSPQTSL